mgnify:FL=1
MAVKIMAERQPPGDRWLLSDEILGGDEPIIIPSLTDCLNQIFIKTGEKVFTIDAAKGTVTVEEERSRGPKVYDLYGEKEVLHG